MWGYLAKNQVPGFWPQTASANCHMPNIGDLALDTWHLNLYT